jgi:ubiquinone/menaquinone biosynthesis C-methylase UbiE
MFTDPIKNLKAFGFKGNDVVVDLGAGTGFYSVALGHMVPHGKVYAIEIVKDFLDTIRNKIKESRLTNVEVIWGDIEKLGGTKIGDDIADAVIVSNVLFQVEDKNQFLEEIKRILKTKGRVFVIDWVEASPLLLGVSPKKALPKNKVREMFEKKGFFFQREINTGSHHYGIILIKN